MQVANLEKLIFKKNTHKFNWLRLFIYSEHKRNYTQTFGKIVTQRKCRRVKMTRIETLWGINCWDFIVADEKPRMNWAQNFNLDIFFLYKILCPCDVTQNNRLIRKNKNKTEISRTTEKYALNPVSSFRVAKYFVLLLERQSNIWNMQIYFCGISLECLY